MKLQLFSLAGVVVGGAIVGLPKTRFPDGLGMVRYTRIGDLASNHGSVASNDAGTALQMYTPDSWLSTSERCVDEYFGLKALPKGKIIQILESFKYEVCQAPKSKSIDEFPAALEHYDIEAKLTCPEKSVDVSDWVRLDCKVTKKGNVKSFFVVSRSARKPTSKNVLQRAMWGKKDSIYFKDRIRCRTNERSLDQQLKECKFLVMNFLDIENARCASDPTLCRPIQENQKKRKTTAADTSLTTDEEEDETVAQQKQKAKREKTTTETTDDATTLEDTSSSTESDDESVDEATTESGVDSKKANKKKAATTKAKDPEEESAGSMSSGTIALIVGGCILLLGCIFAAFKLMGGGGESGQKQDGAKRRKGKKESSSSRPHKKRGDDAEQEIRTEQSEPDDQQGGIPAFQPTRTRIQ